MGERWGGILQRGVSLLLLLLRGLRRHLKHISVQQQSGGGLRWRGSVSVGEASVKRCRCNIGEKWGSVMVSWVTPNWYQYSAEMCGVNGGGGGRVGDSATFPTAYTKTTSTAFLVHVLQKNKVLHYKVWQHQFKVLHQFPYACTRIETTGYYINTYSVASRTTTTTQGLFLTAHLLHLFK